jgi:sarcosine oxidase
VRADVAVAGLGAMGAAAAWRLAERGVRVLGFDRFAPPHQMGSHHGGSRIIRELAFEGPQYVPLVRRAAAGWSALEAATGHKLLLATGALYAGPPGSQVVAGSRASAEAHGVACEHLSAEQVRLRFPALAPAEGMVGLLERRAGVLVPERCVSAMLQEARRRGAELRFDEPVLEWRAGSDGVDLHTAGGRYQVGALVLAMGAWMPPVLAPLGVSLEVERVVQHWFAPADGGESLAPERCPVYLWEDEAGVVFYGFPLLEGAVKCAVHHRGEVTTAEAVRREVRPGEVETAHAYLRRLVPAAAGSHVASAACVYTNAPDGHLIVDRHPEHPRVALASPCSGIGFKFAPAVGEGLAQLALEGAAPAELLPFSLARLLGRPDAVPGAR